MFVRVYQDKQGSSENDGRSDVNDISELHQLRSSCETSLGPINLDVLQMMIPVYL